MEKRGIRLELRNFRKSLEFCLIFKKSILLFLLYQLLLCLNIFISNFKKYPQNQKSVTTYSMKIFGIHKSTFFKKRFLNCKFDLGPMLKNDMIFYFGKKNSNFFKENFWIQKG